MEAFRPHLLLVPASVQRPSSPRCLTRAVDFFADLAFGAFPGARAMASCAGRPCEASASTRASIASLLTRGRRW